MSFRVLRPGLLTTVQDLGRPGMQRYGVVVGGAMDTLSLRIANLLVGNDENSAGLEMTLLGSALQFEQDAVVALCGGEFSATLGEQPLPLARPVFVRKGSVLTCGPASAGCRGYLAVAGGINVPVLLGSRSTYLPGRIGGFQGRSLQTGDVIPLGEVPHSLKSFPNVPWRAGSLIPRCDHQAATLRLLPASEHDWLTPRSRQQLFAGEYEVTPQSDRMGYRLSGSRLELETPRELLSTAVCPGVLEVPAGGQPILFMADCVTTGGYPKVGCVASVDLPRAAQLRPGDKLRFAPISLAEAQSLLHERERDLARLKAGLAIKLREL